MDIETSRKCNAFNITSLERYFRVGEGLFLGYYNELLADEDFVSAVNAQMSAVRKKYGFTKGIFRMEKIDSVDWFAFERILLYVLIRHLKPKACLETGVYYGGNTAFMLRALERNGAGLLISIDLPDSKIRISDQPTSRHPLVGDSEFYEQALKPGFMVPERLLAYWRFIEGDSHRVIPKLEERFDFYIHDSDHSMSFVRKELALAHARMNPSGVMVVDDIDWSNGFHAFCCEQKLFPLLLTDNGKDNLRVRMGLVALDHPNARLSAITG
jgi:predicted O-methyltransferase YrrM